MLRLFDLDPSAYAPNWMHGTNRVFPETNCYVDLWIELLHSLGIEPESAMSFALFTGFEGDQWTFFKPPPDTLLRLFGIDVHEMQLYRSTPDHIAEQIEHGNAVIVEVDSFYLPDRAGTAYRCGHVKSSIAIESIDAKARRLRYFHGGGYYELKHGDYDGVLRLGRIYSEDVLPPYVERVSFDAGQRLGGTSLIREARKIFAEQFERRPKHNPWLAFGERLSRDLSNLLAGSERDYHAYAFATLRQCGAAFECAQAFLNWFAPGVAAEASNALGRQVSGAKNLLFRLARRRQFDPQPAILQLAADWETTMSVAASLLSPAPVEMEQAAR